MGLFKRQVALQAGIAVAIGLCLVWAYWPTFLGLSDTWSKDPNYSQGFLIPILALGIFFQRCWGKGRVAVAPDAWGLGVLLLATVLRLIGAFYYVTPLDHLSLLLVLTAFCLLYGGRVLLVRAWPALVFLVFMIPIPKSLGGTALINGLQEVSTAASTFSLQTLGVPVYREGNVLVLKETELGIVEACSGLRMLMVFCAMSTATSILLPYGWKRRTVLIASAVPLALICNVARITGAGLAGRSLGSEAGHFVFHDLAGWLMVPLAFALLGGEIFLLSRLFWTGEDSAPFFEPSSIMAAVQKAERAPAAAATR
jgi:exosortase